MKEFSRWKKLQLTTLFSLIFEMCTIVSGFILPRLYLIFWGSKVNGLVSSVTQFLGLISFLDMGVGQVVQSVLYKPLSNKDYTKVSEIVSSGKNFFSKLACLFLIYAFVLAFTYPLFANSTFDYFYIVLLIIILSVNSFFQYYFGVNYQILLNSDQRGYVQYIINIITLIVNIGATITLLYAGFGLHVVKFSTAIIFLFRPLLMHLYVKKKYPQVSFNKKLSYEPIKQKWDGLVQHIASVVLTNTDVVILTLFSSLENVSIYSVYNMVINGISQLFLSSASGVRAVLGELWSNNRIEELRTFFSKFEWTVHTIVTIVFGCTLSLIIPFVMVYTNGINDTNYYQPLFSAFIVLANACHCLRLPYNMMTLAGGHFKQTQKCYIVSAIINISISIIFVVKKGLIGVAIGTLVSMIYQTIWLASYLSKNFFKLNMSEFWKQIFVDAIIILLSLLATSMFKTEVFSYIEWVVLAIKKTVFFLLISLSINLVFYREKVLSIIKRIMNRFLRQ